MVDKPRPPGVRTIRKGPWNWVEQTEPVEASLCGNDTPDALLMSLLDAELVINKELHSHHLDLGLPSFATMAVSAASVETPMDAGPSPKPVKPTPPPMQTFTKDGFVAKGRKG